MDRENDMPVSDDVETPTIDDTNEADASEADEAQPDDAEDDSDQGAETDEADDANQSDEDDGESDDADDGDDEAKAETEDLVEIEVNGKLKKVDPDVAKAIMQERDYTQGKQAIADERRALGEMRASLENLTKVSNEQLNAYTHLQAAQAQYAQITKTLDEFAQVNWQALKDQDYSAYERAADDYRTLQMQERQARSQIEKINGDLQGISKQRQQAIQQELRARFEGIQAQAKREIPGFNEQVDRDVTNYMRELGADDFWLAQHLSPALFKAAWKAMQYDRVQSKAKAAKPKQERRDVKPTTRIKSRSGGNPRKSIAEMSVEEYAAHMNRKEAAARNRKYA